MLTLEEYIDIETLHSSWIRTMFEMVSIGIILITLFKDHKKLKRVYIIPLSIMFIGIFIGMYSVYFTYYSGIDTHDFAIKRYNLWKYISILTCGIFIFVSIYMIKYF